jgi:hypothetical protein
LNYESSSFLSWQLENYTGFPCNNSHTLKLKANGIKTKQPTHELKQHYAAGRATLPLKNETLARKIEDREQTQRRN